MASVACVTACQERICKMIKVMKVSGETIYINEDYIEWIESTPDTLIKIHDGTTFTVQETPDDILKMMREWKKTRRGMRE